MMFWDSIDTVLLDLDGVIIDRRFDNTVWERALVEGYAKNSGYSVTEAKKKLFGEWEPPYDLTYYSIDYWSEVSGVDLIQLHWQYRHLIEYQFQAKQLLETLRNKESRTLIVTNADPRSVQLKNSITHFLYLTDNWYSAHNFGYSKEDLRFWNILLEKEHFDPRRSMYIDDQVHNLQAAQEFGVKHLYLMEDRDSARQPSNTASFEILTNFDSLVA